MWVSGAADRSENWGFGELVFRGAPEGCGGAGDPGKRPVEELLVPHCFFLRRFERAAGRCAGPVWDLPASSQRRCDLNASALDLLSGVMICPRPNPCGAGKASVLRSFRATTDSSLGQV